MIQNNYGEMIFSENDVCDLLMRGHEVESLRNMIVDESVNIEKIVQYVDHFPKIIKCSNDGRAVADWDSMQQGIWHMPQEYKDMDIAQHILDLCDTDAELQRCGHELLLYQERNLFDLLKYLKYLVDVMTEHHVIWGVGRGSSVASYVLYKLGVHRINSMFYELKVEEFLR